MNPDTTSLERFLARAERLLERLEPLLPPASPAPDWDLAPAFRWRKRGGAGFLQPILHAATIRLSDLQDIDEQKSRVVANTRQFLKNKPANNVLLTGARGSGKSSLIKALLNEFSGSGLRVIEVDKNDLVDLPDIIDLVAGRRERFIVFSDEDREDVVYGTDHLDALEMLDPEQLTAELFDRLLDDTPDEFPPPSEPPPPKPDDVPF